MIISAREFARLIEYSPRQVGRMRRVGLLVESSGKIEFEQSIARLLRNCSRRLRISESLCKRFLGDELAVRYAAEGIEEID